MNSYKTLLYDVMHQGVPVPTRAVLQSTGEQVCARSLIGYQWRHDLAEGFPILTTKKIHFKSVVAELLWFLSGSTNVKDLQAMGCHIWDQWARRDGSVGPAYGSQWRDFLGMDHYGDHDSVDQIAQAIDQINQVKADPFASCGRRIIVSAWNPTQIYAMALPPCHYTFQFLVRSGKLHCCMVMRSADAFLGVPFNIASYALLTHLVALKTGLDPGTLTISFHDLHIYENHLDQVREQLARQCRFLPTLKIDVPDPWSLDTIQPDQISLIGYNHRGAIKAEVAV